MTDTKPRDIAVRGGALIAFEGIDGAGKTTQVDAIAALLKLAGVRVVRTKEPTDGPWGRRIRQSAATGRMEPAEELKCFLRDRREHVETFIRPHMDSGHVVLVDRYFVSTIAYQGARGLDVSQLVEANAFAVQPDACYLLDVDVEIGVQRIASRGDLQNEFEQTEYLKSVLAVFRSLRLPWLHTIDARPPADVVTRAITTHLLSDVLHDKLCSYINERGECPVFPCIEGPCAFKAVADVVLAR